MNSDTTREQTRADVLKKKNYMYIYFIAALLVIVILGYLYFDGKFKRGDNISPQLRQMQQMVNKVRGLENDIQERQNEIFSLMQEYKEKTGEELPAVNLLSLSPEEKTLLEEKIQQEQDVSMKALLNDILEKNNDIDALRDQIKELEELLPRPHVVVRDENHYQVAMNFLLNEKGVEKKQALKLIERALLFDPLVPGFKVWNFYDGTEYGTFITQGTAAISPNEVRRRSKKKLVDARDQAIAEKDKLSLDIEALENRRGQLITQLDLLNQEKGKLIVQIGELHKENTNMQTKINSLYYMVDSKKNLKKKGIIKGGFLRSLKLKNVDPKIFTESVDLRGSSDIIFAVDALELDKIKKVRVYPKYYKENVDYRISIAKDGKEAQLTILSLDKLRNERVVISVE